MATRNCADCTYDEVNNAVNGVAGGGGTWTGSPCADGDIINLPAGTVNWGTSQLSITKAIVLAGAGMASTVISSAYAGTSLANYGSIRWFPTISPSYQWGPRGLTFNYSGGNTAIYFNGTSTGTANPVLGVSAGLRMTDVKVASTSGTNGVLLRWTDIIGLVDHCILDTGADGYQWGLVYHSGWNGRTNSHGSYEQPVNWGTIEFLYFEDCWIVWGGQDAHDGARYVTRHCRFTNGARPLNHGTESHPHGCRAIETYQNWTSGISGSWAETRSGTMICHDNILQGANATYSCQNHRNFARKNGGSTRGENPSFATQTIAEAGLVNNTGGYSGGTTTMTVDAFVGKVSNGYIFQVEGEVPKNTLHTITAFSPPTGNTTSITFTPALAAAVPDNAEISVLVPPLDKFTPLADESLAPGDGNEPINGNVAPDEDTGTATATMVGDTATFTDSTAAWTTNQWKTVNDSDYTLNSGFCYQLVNTDDIRMATSVILSNTTTTITVATNPGATTVPLAFTIGQAYAIRKCYAGADQPGMGVIKTIASGAWLANTNTITGVCSTANVNSPTGTRAIGWPNQQRDPNYNWNNYNTTGAFGTGTLLKMTTSQGILLGGRDIIEDVKPVDGAVAGYPEIDVPGYPETSSPTSEQRQVGAKGITGVSDATILYGQTITDVYGLNYPHPYIVPPTGTKIISVPTSNDFGSVLIGQTATYDVPVTNNGDTTLSVTAVSQPTGYTSPGSDSFTVGAGLTVTKSIVFTPVAATTYSGNVVFTSDATSGNATMAVTGIGVEEGGGGGKGKGHKKGALSRRA